MRDPNRIPEILHRIEVIWLRNPDLRLGQIISHVVDPKYLYEIDDEKFIKMIEYVYKTADETC